MTRDPLFNESAAQWAYDLVMKMDEDAAASLATMVIAETLWEEIEKNKRTLTRHLNEVVAKREARLLRALDRVVAKGAEADQVELMREAISKAADDDLWTAFDEAKRRRDKSGRFTFKVNYSADNRPIKPKYSKRIPYMPSEDDPKIKDLSDQQKARFQQGYMQIANFLDAAQLGEEDSIEYLMRDRSVGNGAGRLYRKTVTGSTDVPDIDPASEEFVAARVKPKNTERNQIDLATFGLISALGGTPAAARYGADQMKLVNDRIEPFANDWTGAGSDGERIGSSNARLYGRVATGSQYLAEFQQPGSKPWIATKLAQFAGERGPEAEKVLGPKIRQAMYRYRGTEKKPDREIVDLYERARGAATLANLSPEQRGKLKVDTDRVIASFRSREGRNPTPAERRKIVAGISAGALGIEGGRGSADERSTAAGAHLNERAHGVLIAQMLERVPDPAFYDLQLKAGHTPPSEGVMVDKDGDVVIQAVGYADDHYLPFNLKNLKKLKGGSYVRTRSVGGPTTEDIYTGMVAGADQVTVVSRSGVFVITFDETFRGTRRYNDKAARMVKRYGKILDAVQSQQADRQGLEASIRRQIRDEVTRSMSAYADPKAIKNEIQRREREAKLYPTISREDEEKIDLVAAQMERDGDARGAQAYRMDARNKLLDKKAYTWKLNGDGYGAALKSLEEQFPYYISVKYTPRDDVEYAAEPDRGYVKPRHLRPHEAQEGYFDTSIAGESAASIREGKNKGSRHDPTGKFSADSADYQNWRHNPNNDDAREAENKFRTSVGAAPKEEGEKAKEAEGARRGDRRRETTPEEKAIDEMRRAEADKDAARKAADIWEALETKPTSEGGPRIAKDVREEYPALFKPGQTREEFIRDFKTIKPQFEKFMKKNISVPRAFSPEELEIWKKYAATQTQAGSKSFSRRDHLDVEDVSEPYGFSGAAYLASANRALRVSEMSELNNKTPLTALGKPLSEFKDKKDFTTAVERMVKLRRRSQLIQSRPDKEAMITALVQSNEIPEVPQELVRIAVNQPDVLDDFAENTHRYWLLWTREQGASPEDEKKWDAQMDAPDPGPTTPPSAPPTTSPTPKGPTTPPSSPVPGGTVRPVPKVKVTAVRDESKKPRRDEEGRLDESGWESPDDHPEVATDHYMRRRNAYRAWATTLNRMEKDARDTGKTEYAAKLAMTAYAFTEAANQPVSPVKTKDLGLRVAELQALEPEFNATISDTDSDISLPDIPQPWKRIERKGSVGKSYRGHLVPLG